MNKRDFIKTGFIGILSILSIPLFARRKTGLFSRPKEFQLPRLPYAYNALEPYINEETMIIHHDRIHAAITSEFNLTLKKSALTPATVREILVNASKHESSVVNQAGGYFNHRLFWKSISPAGGGDPTGNIAELIVRDFDDFGNFKEQLRSEAKKVWGHGWVWLVIDNGNLKITSTTHENNPLMDAMPDEKRGFPLLCIDVWDHAYTQYQNQSTEYIDAFWNVVNWENANKKLNKFMAG
jgi:Fe-Mn family superoxide dismutase